MILTEKQLRRIIDESLLNLFGRRSNSSKKVQEFRIWGYCETVDSGKRFYSSILAELPDTLSEKNQYYALQNIAEQIRSTMRVKDISEYKPAESYGHLIVTDLSGNKHIIYATPLTNICINLVQEGKLGRALGTMALGGALMMGNPQDANAQLNVRTTARTPEREQSSLDYLRNNLMFIRLVDDCSARRTYAFDYLSDKECCKYQFANSDDSAFQSLNDLLSLIDNRTGIVYVDDIWGDEFSIEYVNATKGALLVKAIWANEPNWYMYLTREDIEKAINIVKKHLKQ